MSSKRGRYNKESFKSVYSKGAYIKNLSSSVNAACDAWLKKKGIETTISTPWGRKKPSGNEQTS